MLSIPSVFTTEEFISNKIAYQNLGFFDKAEADFKKLKEELVEGDRALAENCLNDLQILKKKAENQEKSFFKNIVKSSKVYEDVSYISSIPDKVVEGNKIVEIRIAFADFDEIALEIELFTNKLPKTTNKFMSIIDGFQGFELIKSQIARIIPNFGILMGDVVRNDGTGLIPDFTYADESFPFKHKRGALSLHNFGKPNNNNSLFYIITSEDQSKRDKKAVVFGIVRKGLSKLESKLLEVDTDEMNRPEEGCAPIIISTKYLN